MKILSTLFCAAVLGGGFSSCTQVTVTEPFGLEPAQLDPDDWNGVWRFDDGDRGKITVSKDRRGEFVFSEVPDPKAEPKEKSDDLTVTVREVDGNLFFTVTGEGDKKAEDGKQADGEEVHGGLPWGRLAMNKNTLLVWLPEVDAFAPLVKNGTIPGEDKRKKDEKTGSLSGSIVLGKLDEAQQRAIAGGKHGVLFGWDDPIVLLRDPFREPEAEPAPEAEE